MLIPDLIQIGIILSEKHNSVFFYDGKPFYAQTSNGRQNTSKCQEVRRS